MHPLRTLLVLPLLLSQTALAQTNATNTTQQFHLRTRLKTDRDQCGKERLDGLYLIGYRVGPGTSEPVFTNDSGFAWSGYLQPVDLTNSGPSGGGNGSESESGDDGGSGGEGGRDGDDDDSRTGDSRTIPSSSFSSSSSSSSSSISSYSSSMLIRRAAVGREARSPHHHHHHYRPRAVSTWSAATSAKSVGINNTAATNATCIPPNTTYYGVLFPVVWDDVPMGLEMMPGTVSYAEWQPVRLAAGYDGSSAGQGAFYLGADGESLLWTQAPSEELELDPTGFGGWLVCEWWISGTPQLFFRVEPDEGATTPSCADVDLVLEYF